MAPIKNPNAINKNACNNISNSHNTTSSSSITNATNSGNSSSSSSTQRKQTGTVPKSSSKSTSNMNVVAAEAAVGQQNGQKPILQPPGVAQMANRCSPLNIVSSIQQQQQQQQHMRYQQQYKNTEIVAPIRRELKDLNDYLLTTVVTTANNTNINQQQQQSNTASTNSDLENSQENQQRFCYPVRPIPRRNLQQQNNNQQTQNDFLNSSQNLNSNLNTAIGVVIPTTPGLPSSSVQPNAASLNDSSSSNILGPQFEQHLQLLVLQRLRQLFENSQTQPFLNLTTNLLPTLQASSSASLAQSVLNHNSNEFSQLSQRFQQSLSSNHKANLENSLQNQQKALKNTTMVHEITPNTSAQDVVVNSTSLEDVALSEMSNRAQSIQSLHSNVETPTPDNTPSYEDLQQRLEASNRNIQNMQEQQQQLLKLQNAAKQHLSDMEKLRQQAQALSFPSGSQRGADGGDGAPEYESIDQVHSDMASLVGRMKNLTAFIQNQNELSSLMGDDGPEILAEQELLQSKLESLRTQRDEMRNLVSELQTINRSAEETAKEARQRQYEQEKDIEENEPPTVSPKTAQPTTSKKASNVEREVPVEYSRNVPIELLQQAQRQHHPTNGHLQSESEADIEDDDNEAQRKVAADIIQQKAADIDAMKAQLKRLKEMMETVNIIEDHTSKDPKSIGRTQPREVPIAFDRERTPIAMPINSRYCNDDSNEEFIARKVRMLNEVTSDLRAQAESLQSEKDRIQALKNEIERRKQQAAAAVQMGDDALKRNSLTPTPIPRNTHESRWDEHVKTQHERDQLKEEYQLKKKEFERLCKRLEQEDPQQQQQQQSTPTRRHDIVSEADDEAEEDNIDSDYAASTKFVPTSTPAATRTNEQTTRSVKDSLNSTGASSNAATHIALAASSTHDGASLEAASMQSGSSRSFSIPPPMSAMGMNFPGPIPPPLPSAWNPHQYYYATGVPPPPPPPQATFGLNPPSTNGGTILNTSECICTANNLGAATSSSTATSATTNAPLTTTDPMLQQFIQTQQMLINSVCQCNQMLWHQQREIDSLNQTIHILQERLLAITAGNVNGNATNDIGYGLRSESVPPQSLNGIPTNQALPNNLYLSMNRAQSEQPIAFIPGQNRNSAFSNYQQQQQQHLYRHQRMAQPHGGFNFTSETQQHNTSTSASASMYSTLNNAVPQPPPPAASTHFNNEIPTPQSPVVGSGPAPIFMHHHNNAIHQNNVNLRTQNQQQQHHHSNLSHTLNNQVPPGNRANNYWDNFRSYSRQNLLSTNSTKSNEEQQMQHQQQQDAQYERPTSMQQQQHPGYNFQQQNQNLDECSNNLNYVANNESASSAQNKYLRIMQRSRINQQQQQQQYQQNIYQQQRDFLQQLNWLEQHENTNNATTNTAAPNASDLMYHNYNIQQQNKVGPKPNWRFRNINAEYNPSVINRHQQQQQQQPTSLQRYQNTLTFQQQPLQHFLNLPQQTAASRNQDFLLRSAVELGEEDVNYNFLNSQQQQQLPIDFSNSQQQNDNIPLDCNENNEDDEDDTTSEEIKRNLLVNALKNDKFTTKFYESIKEDVFRRLESMLLDKDNVNTEPTISQQQLFNNISHNALRKLNLNEQRDQLLQQQLQPLDLNTQQNLTEDSRNVSLQINNESEIPLSNSNNDNESEKPEEDTNWRQNVMNNCSTNNAIPNQTRSINTPITKNVTKKRKNLRKQSLSNTSTTNQAIEIECNENLRGACSLAAQQHQKLHQENQDMQNENNNKNVTTTSSSTSPKSSTSNTNTNEYDLIKYIINRIRNQTHTNTLISDALLVDVAKLTATVAQNAQPLTQNNLGNNPSNISPKKIYFKIKKLSLPKERDEFLSWYQKYLENTIFGNHHPHQNQQSSTEKGKSSSAKQTNNHQQHQQSTDLQAPDDGDLAEADQNCSLNNSGGGSNANSYHHSEDNEAHTSVVIIKPEGMECENNENPGEAQSIPMENSSEPITANNNLEVSNITCKAKEQRVFDASKPEPQSMPASEKSDVKSEKPEFNEKE